MSTYSYVDTVRTPSLINISTVRDVDSPQGIIEQMGSLTNNNLSPRPNNFPTSLSFQNGPMTNSDNSITEPTTHYASVGSAITLPISDVDKTVPSPHFDPFDPYDPYEVFNSMTISNPVMSPTLLYESGNQSGSPTAPIDPYEVFNSMTISNPVMSPTLLYESENQSMLPSDESTLKHVSNPMKSPLSPIESISSVRKSQVSGNNIASSIGPLPMKSIPAFAPPKNISVSNASHQTLQSQLKNRKKDVREKAVKILEKKIITMQGKCPDDIVENLRIRTFQLDPALISSYLTNQGLYDHDFQDGVGCLIDALISDEDIVPDARLRRWITDINKIGGASAEGMAFKLESNSSPLYVIKVAADPSNDSLPHEALVGMAAINRLRDRIPNFMHTYGAFMCAPPILDSAGKITSWCPAKTNEITYLVLENIPGASPLSSTVWNITDSEFLQVYLQILNALNVAYKEFDYTHYDLHDGNVLIQVLPYDIAVPLYNPDGSVLYIKTRLLARIIDFGISHIYLQGQHFGKYNLELAGVDPESSFPMHDAYKLLLFSYASSLKEIKDGYVSASRSSSDITAIVNGIYEFFKEGKTADQRIEERNKDPWVDYFQPSISFKSMKLDDLIAFIISKYSPSFVTKDQPTDVVMTICRDACVDWNSFTQQVFDRNKLPNTLEDYCQAQIAIDKLATDNYKEDLRKWLQQFNAELAYNLERDVMVPKLNDLILDLNKINLNSITDPSFNFRIYENNIRDLIAIRSRIQNIQIWVASTVCAFNRTQKIQYISSDMVQIMKGINDIKGRFTDFQNIIRDNIQNDVYEYFDQTEHIPLLHSILLNNP